MPGYIAMAFFGIILARKEHAPLSASTVRHETIHERQAKECGGWFRFYARYLMYWVRYGYINNPFEKEAYSNQFDSEYLASRPSFNWRNYLK